MLSNKEYKFIIITLVIFLLISFGVFYNTEVSIFERILFALALEGIAKTTYDVIMKTGHQGMYIYSDLTNQILRYIVWIVTSLFAMLFIILLLGKI